MTRIASLFTLSATRASIPHSNHHPHRSAARPPLSQPASRSLANITITLGLYNATHEHPASSITLQSCFHSAQFPGPMSMALSGEGDSEVSRTELTYVK